MRFSKTFGITHHKKDDWFDPVLDQDTPLYIDPFLVFDDNDPTWLGARSDVLAFFNAVAGLIGESGGNTSSPAYQKAIRLLMFPEPKEFALGVSMGSPIGSGTGEKVAKEIAEMLVLLEAHDSIDDLATIAGFTLFCDGVGLDGISDILCNVLKARFVSYTQDIAKDRDVPMVDAMVAHADWDRKNLRWIDKKVPLPESGVTRGGVLLSPQRFLKEIPRVSDGGFWQWAETNAAKELRDDLNYDLSKGLTVIQRRKAARDVAKRRPGLVGRYIHKIETEDLEPYDVEADPKRLVHWREFGENAALGLMSEADEPEDAASFPAFVLKLATDFQHQVENTDLWTALWHSDKSKHVREKVVQAIAGAMWTAECRAADIDLSQEVNRGRGPVDFKFSKGWSNRALLEVKFIENTQFFNGASEQLPQYLQTEQIEYGVFLCIGFTDEDFSPARKKRVEDAAIEVGKQKGVKVDIVYVDARKGNKKSASKLRQKGTA